MPVASSPSFTTFPADPGSSGSSALTRGAGMGGNFKVYNATSVSLNGSLPPGISWSVDFSSNNIYTSGAPTTNGTYSFSWTATNNPGGGYTPSSLTSASWSYVVSDPPPPPTYPPSWSDTALVSGQVGVAYSDGVSATNMNYSGSYSVSTGSLPAGLSLNTSTGAITGTPTTATSYNFTITATNSYGSISQAFTMTVAAPALTGHVQVYNGTSWVDSEVYVFNGSTWVLAQVYKYSGSAWVMSQ